jgi:hypothetical protein
VRDSVLGSLYPEDLLIIKTCEGYREFFFNKENNHWRGYLLKNLEMMGGIMPPHEENEKVILVEIMTFDADKLYASLQKYKLDKLKQLSNDQLMEPKKVSKNTYMSTSLPVASHDCNFTIINQKNHAVTYTNVIIAEERLQRIPDIKKIHTLYEYLKAEFKAYY